ncbi:hypothetical protein CRUP_036336 [Coryphaenoides rupestris]|nr:hypothetical protein CRUP_036336 [Coryphaenoides rupestris]
MITTESTNRRLEDLRADAEDSVMALSSMLRSPYCSDFRPEVEHWARLLQQLEELLEMLERYQETWAFLTKMLNETCAGTQSAELLERFQAVDETFMEIIFSISSDHHVLNVLRPKDDVSRHLYGHDLRMKLLGGLASMEAIATCLGKLLDRPRGVFPRLCFLSDQEVMKLCTSQPAPADLLAIVGKCFQGVRRLELHHDVPSVRADGSACQSADGFSVQMKVLAEFGSLVEHCLLVAEESAWCSEVLKASQIPSPDRRCVDDFHRSALGDRAKSVNVPRVSSYKRQLDRPPVSHVFRGKIAKSVNVPRVSSHKRQLDRPPVSHVFRGKIG